MYSVGNSLQDLYSTGSATKNIVGKAVGAGISGASNLATKGLLIGSIGAVTVAGASTLGNYAAKTGGNFEAGAIAGGALGLGAGIGTAALWANKGAIGKAVGKGVWSGTKKLGSATIVGAKKTGAYIAGVAEDFTAKEFFTGLGKGALNVATPVAKAAGTVGAVGVSAAARSASKIGGAVGSMFKFEPNGSLIPNMKLTNLGKMAVVGGGVVGAGVQAFNTFNDARRGTPSDEVVTATPNVPKYSSQMRNAGATGDLNFSMYRNRR